ncbi:phosphate ABC transporter permease PstA [Halolamina litorea]|uniref:Phosphate transport system permease protein PstA n=1 Tax=Halolamina litorea TaxID=1515593 RepID=A0ABD6BSR3_9EURY|nr:phosphate ABC transporter permease PstA [Halolamina litorea]
MAGATQPSLSVDTTDRTRTFAGVTVALCTLLFVAALAALFGQISLTDPIAGVPALTVIGSTLLLVGGAVVGLGVASRTGYTVTDPRPSAGVTVGLLLGAVGATVGGVLGGVVLGLSGASVFAVTLLTGFACLAATVLPRGDVGTTLAPGVLTALVGLVFLSGIIGPEWAWSLGWEQQASLTAGIIVPTATLTCALLGGWAAAVASRGFGARGRHAGAYLLVYLNASAIIGVLLVLVAFVVYKGLPGLFRGAAVGLGVGPDVFGVALPVDVPFAMNGVALMNDVNGVLPAIVGTIWLVVGAVLLAVPLGVGAAVFLTEYAPQGRFTQVVEVATNGLWSTPSIVFGLFGFAFLVPRFGNQKSLLAGAITLGFMLLPLVIITSREAMLSVPDEYRDASAALGVSKWQTIRSVVLPAAAPGVVTGVILGVGRIAGETAPILLTMAGGVFVPGSQTVDVIGGFQFTAAPPFVSNPELLQATSALPYQLYALITAGVGASGNVGDADAFRWATALVLLVVVLSFYAIGIAARQYFRRKIQR